MREPGDLNIQKFSLVPNQTKKLYLKYDCNFIKRASDPLKEPTECLITSISPPLPPVNPGSLNNLPGSNKIERTKQLVDINYDVPFFSQPTAVTCWATSMAMVIQYCKNQREGTTIVQNFQNTEANRLIKEMCKVLGIPYDKGNGLPWDETRPYVAYGFQYLTADKIIADNQASLDNIRQMLEQYGPLIISYDTEPGLPVSGHSVVLKGMAGDGTPEGTTMIIHDPDNSKARGYPNPGTPNKRLSFKSFVRMINSALEDAINKPKINANYLNVIAYLPCN